MWLGLSKIVRPPVSKVSSEQIARDMRELIWVLYINLIC